METGIIPVRAEMVGSESIQAVNARELYDFLDVESNFTTWMTRRIEEGAFVEGQDFLPKKEENRKGRPSKGYIISLDMAKHLCMLERNDKGKQARQYFVDCEKKLRQVAALSPAPAAPSPAEALHQMTGLLVAQERQLSEVKAITDQHTEDIRRLTVQAQSDVDYCAIRGWCRLNKIRIPAKNLCQLGKKASRLSRELDVPIGSVPDEKYATVNTYRKDILSVVFAKFMKKAVAA